MKKFILIFLALYLISCQKDNVSPQLDNPEYFSIIEDNFISNEQDHKPYIVDGNSYENAFSRTNDTLLIEYFKCPTNVICNIIPGAAPQETAIGAQWGNGDWVTVGLFNWIPNSTTIVCADNIVFEGPELFVYKNNGDGEWGEVIYQQLPNSSPILIDTIFRSQIFSGYYTTDSIKLGYRFYTLDSTDMRMRIDSLILVK